ncbi:22314_t:CDS:2 [Cetraspora pellucida]|uniref:22314_t:CDS:1 n=1 Tax=Cetraspora pellucida TaxID=1433469 RepID=A0A9N9GVK7_9GLOM|nr:22314_t:CDS:2 [Cetraspora pellucida]
MSDVDVIQKKANSDTSTKTYRYVNVTAETITDKKFKPRRLPYPEMEKMIKNELNLNDTSQNLISQHSKLVHNKSLLEPRHKEQLPNDILLSGGYNSNTVSGVPSSSTTQITCLDLLYKEPDTYSVQHEPMHKEQLPNNTRLPEIYYLNTVFGAPSNSAYQITNSGPLYEELESYSMQYVSWHTEQLPNTILPQLNVESGDFLSSPNQRIYSDIFYEESETYSMQNDAYFEAQVAILDPIPLVESFNHVTSDKNSDQETKSRYLSDFEHVNWLYNDIHDTPSISHCIPTCCDTDKCIINDLNKMQF